MDYHLKQIGRTCAGTGEELLSGSTCFSALVERDGQLVRLDYSQEGWTGPPEGTIGYWQSVVPEPDETKAKPLDTDALMRYFEQLSEDANPAQEKLRYVLSLLLLQKRRLLRSKSLKNKVERSYQKRSKITWRKLPFQTTSVPMIHVGTYNYTVYLDIPVLS